MADRACEYVAFFRNMNLGHCGSPVRASLEQAFVAAGGGPVRSFQTNGTVVFGAAGDAAAGDGAAVTAAALGSLAQTAGFHDAAFTRTMDELRVLVAGEPFADFARADTYRECVTIFADGPVGGAGQAPSSAGRLDVELPWTSAWVDIVGVAAGVALSVVRVSATQVVGNPTRAIETLTGGPATTRTFGTITRLVRSAGG